MKKRRFFCVLSSCVIALCGIAALTACGETTPAHTYTHTHTYNSYSTASKRPDWTWENDLSAAWVKFYCDGYSEQCGVVQRVDATISRTATGEVYWLTGKEKIIYTATVTFQGVTYTDTRTREE